MSLRVRLTSRGETIVEVLVATLVVALILTASYNSAHNSLQSARDAQERGEALKLAESQLEKLKSLATDPSNNVFRANSYCINGLTINNLPSGTPKPNANSDSFSVYQAHGCQSGLYNYAITYTPGSDLFTVYTRWDRLGGGGRNEVKIDYRLHP